MDDGGLTRESVLDDIADACLFGNLGLFVGSGFSKALTGGRAPSFPELLERVSVELGLSDEYQQLQAEPGHSFPIIAQALCEALAFKSDGVATAKTLPGAIERFKRAIAEECELQATPDLATEYRKILSATPKSWIITTNYDFIIESVVDRHVYILPDQVMNTREDFVPIYHMHGHRRAPGSIVITQADYVRALGPLDYRQLRLVLSVTESTTLMLGYGLGDVNVQTAVEWSRRFREEHGLQFAPYQGIVVQGLFTRGAVNPLPYRRNSGELVIETDNLLTLLKEIGAAVGARRRQHEEACGVLRDWMAKPQSAEKLIADRATRELFIGVVKKLPRCYDIQQLIKFLDSALGPTWKKARAGPEGFPLYDALLEVLLDVLENLPLGAIHPSLLSYMAERLDEVSNYIDPELMKRVGDAWAASRTWVRRRTALPIETARELQNYARRHNRLGLLNLLEKSEDAAVPEDGARRV